MPATLRATLAAGVVSKHPLHRKNQSCPAKLLSGRLSELRAPHRVLIERPNRTTAGLRYVLYMFMAAAAATRLLKTKRRKRSSFHQIRVTALWFGAGILTALS